MSALRPIATLIAFFDMSGLDHKRTSHRLFDHFSARSAGKAWHDHGGWPFGDRSRGGRVRFHPEISGCRLGFRRGERLIIVATFRHSQDRQGH
jgi:hypothetical protein